MTRFLIAELAAILMILSGDICILCQGMHVLGALKKLFLGLKP
jgi:hypothetical protein